ncbi:MAG: DUF6223 family protein [Kibdelosporangium sp.]
MSARHLLATPAIAHILAQQTTSAYALTAGRVWSLVAAALGLAGVIIGGLVLARPAGRIATSGKGAIVALGSGLACMVIGGLIVAMADGGPGSGSGIVGGFVALVAGLAAVILGWLARSRARRTA